MWLRGCDYENMKNYSPEIQKFINSQSDLDFKGKYTENNKDENYKIKIIFRGEHLLYKEKDRSMICEIDCQNAIIFKDSIEYWDNSNKIIFEESEIIIKRVLLYFENIQKKKAQIL